MVRKKSVEKVRLQFPLLSPATEGGGKFVKRDLGTIYRKRKD
jgi:hypothetical protein